MSEYYGLDEKYIKALYRFFSTHDGKYTKHQIFEEVKSEFEINRESKEWRVYEENAYRQFEEALNYITNYQDIIDYERIEKKTEEGIFASSKYWLNNNGKKYLEEYPEN